MNNTTNTDVLIIGGGISGLTSAFFLKKRGLKIKLAESRSRAGGSVTSLKKDGFLMDLGPNSMMDTTPLIKSLCDDLGIADKREYTAPAANKRYIVKNGELQPLPFKPPQFLKSSFFSLKTKLGLLKEPFIGRYRGNDDESLAHFTERRLGREFLDYAIDPFVSGIFAGVPEKLSVKSAFPKLYALEEEYGSILKGAVLGVRKRKKRNEESKQSAKMLSFEQGMQTLTDALESNLKNDIFYNTSFDGIKKEDEFISKIGIDGKYFDIKSKAVLFAIPAHKLSDIMFFSEIGDVLVKIYYPPVTVAFTGYKKNSSKIELDGFGFLIPRKENRDILGTIWSSSIFKNRAPEGGAAFTTFIGGARQPGEALKSEDETYGSIRRNFKDLMGIEEEPDIFDIKQWQKAIPQYQPGHSQIIEKIERFENKNRGIFISGNFRGGIAVADCIKQADKFADRIFDFYQSKF